MSGPHDLDITFEEAAAMIEVGGGMMWDDRVGHPICTDGGPPGRYIILRRPGGEGVPYVPSKLT